jgi:hypothetical protein
MIQRILVLCGILFIILLFYVMLTPALPCKVLERLPYKDGTTIEVVNDTCLEGLPHTSNINTIVMPLSVWRSERREDTLRHELVHIRQRRDRTLWYDFYKNDWEYVPVSCPPELDRSTMRPNPDTDDTPYMAWRGRWIFIPLYNEDRTLRNANVHVYDMKVGAFVDIPPEWTAFFSAGLRQYEHPHEISAEFLTTRRICPASKKLYDFFSKNYE